MRHPHLFVLSVFVALVSVGFFLAAPTASFATTTVILDQPVHFTTAEGSDVVLEAGEYDVAAADDWLRVMPNGGTAVDALLLEAQVAKHEETLKAPLGISAQGESPDTHHLALLLPNGTRLEVVGSYSGIRSRGLSLLRMKRIQRLAAVRRSTPPTEFKTPLFGGGGGNRRYDLDCGNQSVLVGVISKSGLWLDAIGIICQQVNAQTGALGNEFTRGPVGGSGGLAKTKRCNQGNVVNGILIASGSFIEKGTFLCTRWIPAEKKPVDRRDANCSADRCTTSFGNSWGVPNQTGFYCPAGKVGKAVRGRRGIYIDSLQFICDFWNK